ncbi:hypothetical protein BMS3Bbin02_00442 [bacterium BMS3Bbin02]|nr:hypothetical protein BMS3Bbin02_00442 [bacterium BMS3Bbin02]
MVENCAVCVVDGDPWVRVGFDEEPDHGVRFVIIGGLGY